jgi:protein-tyrosine-phosphatase
LSTTPRLFSELLADFVDTIVCMEQARDGAKFNRISQPEKPHMVYRALSTEELLRLDDTNPEYCAKIKARLEETAHELERCLDRLFDWIELKNSMKV